MCPIFHKVDIQNEMWYQQTGRIIHSAAVQLVLEVASVGM